MNSYIFKLGHVPDLGRAELATLLNTSYSEIEILNGFAYTSQLVRANDTGSLVWSGEVLFSAETRLRVWTELKQYVLTQAGQFCSTGVKRMGVVLPKRCKEWDLEIIRELKSLGLKGVQVVFGEDNFSFGHYRKTKDWLLVLDSPDSTKIVRLLDMSNQEFWSNLDVRLPQRDMKRGIINLKLARTLANLADGRKLWDPFAGQGRVLSASLDRVTTWVASDIDADCLPELADNVGFAQGFWQRHGKRICMDSDFKPADIQEVFALDATLATQIPFSAKGFCVATEGYLGPALSKNASVQEAEKHLSEIVNMWITTIQQLPNLGIKTVVACLPHYLVLPDLRYQTILKQFSMIDGVEISPLSDSGFILYSREKTRVGHLIFKLKTTRVLHK